MPGEISAIPPKVTRSTKDLLCIVVVLARVHELYLLNKTGSILSELDKADQVVKRTHSIERLFSNQDDEAKDLYHLLLLYLTIICIVRSYPVSRLFPVSHLFVQCYLRLVCCLTHGHTLYRTVLFVLLGCFYCTIGMF